MRKLLRLSFIFILIHCWISPLSATTFPIDLGGDTTVCGSLLLDIFHPDIVSYNWSTNDTTASITVNSSGVYHVEVMDSSGCVGNDTILVIVLPNPLINLGPNAVVCDPIIVDAGVPGFSFVLYDLATNLPIPDFTIRKTGTYYAIGTDQNGCMGSDTIHVTVHEDPEIGWPSDTTICDSVLLNAADSAATYVWSIPGHFDSTYTVKDTGVNTYWVEITSPFGCVSRDTIEIDLTRSPIADFTYNWVNFGWDFEFFDNSIYADSVFWDFGDGQTSTERSPKHTYLFSGAFLVSQIVFNDCGTDTAYIVHNGPYSIEDDLFSQSIYIYPNPARGTFWVKGEEIHAKKLSIEIFNLNGQLIAHYHNDIVVNSFEQKIDLSDLSKGIYTVKIVDESRVAFKRVLLE